MTAAFKIGRRGFLGFMAGGVASAPTLAKGLAHDAANMLPPSALQGYAGGAKAALQGDHGTWKISRIAELKQWLSGGRPEDEHYRRQRALYELEAKERYRLDALRSVSTSHRFSMFTDGNIRRRQALERLEWEHELSQLTGGLL